MSQIPPQKFGVEFVAHLRELLDIAARVTEDITKTHHLTSTASPAGEDRTA